MHVADPSAAIDFEKHSKAVQIALMGQSYSHPVVPALVYNLCVQSPLPSLLNVKVREKGVTLQVRGLQFSRLNGIIPKIHQGVSSICISQKRITRALLTGPTTWP